MNRFTVWYIVFFTALLGVCVAYAEQENQNKEGQKKVECPFIYGHYWQSQRWGWYGAKRVVKTPVEAKEIIEKTVQTTKNIKVVRITDQPYFFVAEIINNNGVIVDRILIDKRTGRMRSMY